MAYTLAFKHVTLILPPDPIKAAVGHDYHAAQQLQRTYCVLAAYLPRTCRVADGITVYRACLCHGGLRNDGQMTDLTCLRFNRLRFNQLRFNQLRFNQKLFKALV